MSSSDVDEPVAKRTKTTEFSAPAKQEHQDWSGEVVEAKGEQSNWAREVKSEQANWAREVKIDREVQ